MDDERLLKEGRDGDQIAKRKLWFLIIYMRASLFWQTKFTIAYTLGRIHGVYGKLKRFKVYVFASLCDGTPYEMIIATCRQWYGVCSVCLGSSFVSTEMHSSNPIS